VHRPLGQQLEDRGADIAALAASSPAAASATRTAWAAEAETAAGIEAEFETATSGAEAATGSEGETISMAGITERAAMAGILLAQMVAKVIAELAAGLPTLLMEGAAVAGPEAEAESAGRRCEWVAHMEWFLTYVGKRRVRFRYVDDISEPIAMQLLRRGGRDRVTTTTPAGGGAQ
jgi:hypothetical protein